ncbi:hypothetical protein RhiJN_05336 [Ceratobasidium sp. AG-Ba]|nr:hypothetical protein RhiJN_05336 [Ceratobasidium sp. AG-Ba]QRW06255.1 hypothetical protein RhiLY_05254 [Ceratobasidium sp. AG-Ba]
MSVPSSPCYIITPYGEYLTAQQAEEGAPLILLRNDEPGRSAIWAFNCPSEHDCTIRSLASPNLFFTSKESEDNKFRFSTQSPEGESLYLGPSVLKIFPPRAALVENMEQPLDWKLKPVIVD